MGRTEAHNVRIRDVDLSHLRLGVFGDDGLTLVVLPPPGAWMVIAPPGDAGEDAGVRAGLRVEVDELQQAVLAGSRAAIAAYLATPGALRVAALDANDGAIAWSIDREATDGAIVFVCGEFE